MDLENYNNKEILEMSPWDFDQSPDGWRKLEATKEYLTAAKLIREYINKNKDRILNPREGEKASNLEIMYFHIGQLLASEGREHWPEAIGAFNQSFYQEGKECWNAYVSATIGFLENDIKKIDDAIKTIEESRGDKISGNMGIVKNFKKALEMGERDYKKIYSWPRN